MQAGLSQEALAQLCTARKLCVSTSSVKRAERGRPVIYRTARSLAAFFAVEVTSLLAVDDMPLNYAIDALREVLPGNSDTQAIDLQVLVGGLFMLAELLRGDRGETYRRMLAARGCKAAAAIMQMDWTAWRDAAVRGKE